MVTFGSLEPLKAMSISTGNRDVAAQLLKVSSRTLATDCYKATAMPSMTAPPEKPTLSDCVAGLTIAGSFQSPPRRTVGIRMLLVTQQSAL